MESGRECFEEEWLAKTCVVRSGSHSDIHHSGSCCGGCSGSHCCKGYKDRSVDHSVDRFGMEMVLEEHFGKEPPVRSGMGAMAGLAEAGLAFSC